MNNSRLINQDSGNVEWYTPSHIIEAARRAMGSIDLDPASSEIANRTVKAETYFSNYGLEQSWTTGNLWMNHPFGRAGNKLWIEKLVNSYRLGHFRQSCNITFASTSEAWFQPLLDYPICFLSPRVNYVGPDGKPVKGVTKGSCVTYLGPSVASFYREFSQLGKIVVPSAP